MRKTILSTLRCGALLTAAGWACAGAAQAASGAAATPDLSGPTCETRVNDTVDKLLACIRRSALWGDMVAFQQIADQNPNSAGHPNRNTGTTGYAASVAYVADRMRQAGYHVTVQPYEYANKLVQGTPAFGVAGQAFVLDQDWSVARLSAGGTLAAPLQAASGSGTGCRAEELAGFVAGRIALLQRGTCQADAQVAHAQAVGAAAVVLYEAPIDPAATPSQARNAARRGTTPLRLREAASVPVIGMASNAVGRTLLERMQADPATLARIDIHTQAVTGIDFNLIADSPYGDPSNVVVVEGHLDAIYGAGMLDNASGSATMLEIALNLARTPTLNQLRYIWFGGEELGLFGSHYYTRQLTGSERQRLAFDVDVDVTATPNYDYLVAAPAYAWNVAKFPPNVVPESQIGNQFMLDYFQQIGVPAQEAWFGNGGTDSNSFSIIGVPNTGILTQQDCCKKSWEVAVWGGELGNYEGLIPSFDGGCVDNPHRWCDNLDNNDPAVMEIASKATAYTVFQLANHPFAPRPAPPGAD